MAGAGRARGAAGQHDAPRASRRRRAEAELIGKLQEQARQRKAQGERPATLRAMLEAYAEDMVARGKGEESIGRIEYTARAIERLTPELVNS